MQLASQLGMLKIQNSIKDDGTELMSSIDTIHQEIKNVVDKQLSDEYYDTCYEFQRYRLETQRQLQSILDNKTFNEQKDIKKEIKQTVREAKEILRHQSWKVFEQSILDIQNQIITTMSHYQICLSQAEQYIIDYFSIRQEHIQSLFYPCLRMQRQEIIQPDQQFLCDILLKIPI
eukprot:EST48583.1 Hypothetical protein SS50377_11194 [Spironucleus salmonicida]